MAIATTNDEITAGIVLWRQRHQLYATVVVKATFTLVPGATMTLRAPLPIERAERMLPQSMGIEPGDLAPCLVQPEIWVRGHAWYPPADGAPSVRVRVALARGPDLLMRKNVEIPIQQDPFVPPYLHALAPLSRTWPVRTRLLGAFDWTVLGRSPMELPDEFDWTYFQAAAADQRLEPLRGDEWIRLEAIHSTILKFDTQLPSATSAITMFGRMDPFRQGVPIRSGLDTVQLDVDQGTCSLVFRGHTPLPVDVALDDLQFVAGLGLPGRPVPNLAPSWDSGVELPPVEDEAAILTTSFIDSSLISALFESSGALPFRGGESSLGASPSPLGPREDNHDAGQTFMLDAQLLEQTLKSQQALPFHERSSVSRPNVPNVVPLEKPRQIEEPALVLPAPITQSSSVFAQNEGLPLPREEKSAEAPTMDAGSTFFLSTEMLEALEGKEATPFVGGEPLPEREEPVDVRLGLPFFRVEETAETERASKTLGAFFLAALDEARKTSVQAMAGRATV